ncbi:hypothetical protein BDZ91DRAFT_764914 [Kalaharituber pfeilii]|nr:hypothetical protein BDZ91DRAFT_764914 [Kalaharituber pfeilii]
MTTLKSQGSLVIRAKVTAHPRVHIKNDCGSQRFRKAQSAPNYLKLQNGTVIGDGQLNGMQFANQLCSGICIAGCIPLNVFRWLTPVASTTELHSTDHQGQIRMRWTHTSAAAVALRIHTRQHTTLHMHRRLADGIVQCVMELPRWAQRGNARMDLPDGGAHAIHPCQDHAAVASCRWLEAWDAGSAGLLAGSYQQPTASLRMARLGLAVASTRPPPPPIPRTTYPLHHSALNPPPLVLASVIVAGLASFCSVRPE